METIELAYVQFKHPFTALVAGATGSGKTVLIRRLLRNHVWTIANVNESKLRVIWIYGAWQNEYNIPLAPDSVEVAYMQTLPGVDDIQSFKPHLIIVDDLMHEMSNNKEMSDWFSKYSHHNNISVMFVVQNLFFKGNLMRTISLNAQYIILLKNARDRNQVAHLGRQLFPNKSKMFINVYNDATTQPYGYLVIDTTTTTPDKYRLRRRLTREEVEHLSTKYRPIVYKI